MLTPRVIVTFLNIAKLVPVLELVGMLLAGVTGTNWDVPGKPNHEVNLPVTQVALGLH